MTAHTPGPWHIKAGYGVIESQDGTSIAGVYTPRGVREVRQANAQFIAAAPETAEQRDELLEALEALARITCRCILDMPLQDCGIPVHKQVKAAIAKAKGEG